MVSAEFKQTVQEGNLVTIRIVLTNDMIIDRSFKTFDEELEYAMENNIAVMQEYDHQPFELNCEKWDKSYLNEQIVDLKHNFCQERITHFKAVISKVLPLQEDDNSTARQHPDVDDNPKTPKGGKTGRVVISEKPVDSTEHGSDTSNSSRNPEEKPVVRSKTGRTIISETPINPPEAKEKNVTDGIGTAMIVGGAAIAVYGVVAVEAAAIGTGVVIAGVGVGFKMSGKDKQR